MKLTFLGLRVQLILQNTRHMRVPERVPGKDQVAVRSVGRRTLCLRERLILVWLARQKKTPASNRFPGPVNVWVVLL